MCLIHNYVGAQLAFFGGGPRLPSTGTDSQQIREYKHKHFYRRGRGVNINKRFLALRMLPVGKVCDVVASGGIGYHTTEGGLPR